MEKITERFFILTPTPTDQTKADRSGNVFPVYLDADGKPMMWSANFPIPAVGTRIWIALNGIGWAVVKGYFESCGYVGVMTLATNPPKWLRAQHKRDLLGGSLRHNWQKEGIGCEFGSEILLKRPRITKVAA